MESNTFLIIPNLIPLLITRKKIAYLHKMGILNPKDNLEFKYKIKEEDVIISLANTRQITFEVTDVCNLNCVYCAYGKFYNNYDIRSNKKNGY